jgi:hypothetical protein
MDAWVPYAPGYGQIAWVPETCPCRYPFPGSANSAGMHFPKNGRFGAKMGQKRPNCPDSVVESLWITPENGLEVPLRAFRLEPYSETPTIPACLKSPRICLPEFILGMPAWELWGRIGIVCAYGWEDSYSLVAKILCR